MTFSHEGISKKNLCGIYNYKQYGPIKNGRIKNQHSDFEKNKEPVLRILGLKNRFNNDSAV